MPFVRFLERRRMVHRSWWLTSVHAGYELVSGGGGLTTTWFGVPCDRAPSPPRFTAEAAMESDRIGIPAHFIY
jgi:hypothetical protein